MIGFIKGKTLYLALVGLGFFILIISYFLSQLTIALNNKTKIKSGFIGVVLLALTTSIPEVVTSFFSHQIADAKYAVFNVFGANSLTMTIMALSFIIFFHKKIAFSFNSNTKLTLLFAIISASWFVAPFLIRNLHLVWGRSSLQLIVYVFFYLGVIKKISKQDEPSFKQASWLSNFSKNQVIASFIMSACILVLGSILLIEVVEKMALSYNLGGLNMQASLAGTLFLSLVTALPEIATFFFLVRLNAISIAINSILGSNFFNIFILAIADLFVIKGSVISFVYQSGFGSITYHHMIFVLVSYLATYLLVNSWFKSYQGLTTLFSLVILGGFIWSFNLF